MGKTPAALAYRSLSTLRSTPVAAILLAGCTTMTLTPAQVRVHEAANACDPGMLQSVDAKGMWWYAAGDVQRQNRFKACMREQLRALTPTPPAEARSTPALPIQGGAAVRAPITVPTWKTGDEWEYSWVAPSGRGTFVWEVDGVQPIGGVPHYIIKTGTRRIYYRVDDLGFTREELDGRVVREITPSNWRFAAFPLKVGVSWTMKYHEERPADRQSEEIERRCSVEAEEMISVPAGTFPTSVSPAATSRMTLGYRPSGIHRT